LSLKLTTGSDRHAEADIIDINIAMPVIPPVETLLHQFRTLSAAGDNGIKGVDGV
jgi:hypothetical protein